MERRKWPPSRTQAQHEAIKRNGVLWRLEAAAGNVIALINSGRFQFDVKEKEAMLEGITSIRKAATLYKERTGK